MLCRRLPGDWIGQVQELETQAISQTRPQKASCDGGACVLSPPCMRRILFIAFLSLRDSPGNLVVVGIAACTRRPRRSRSSCPCRNRPPCAGNRQASIPARSDRERCRSFRSPSASWWRPHTRAVQRHIRGNQAVVRSAWALTSC